MTDPISDMLSRIKTGQAIKSETVNIPHSKIKEEIAKILVAEGYVSKFDSLKRMNKKYLRVTLKYSKSQRGVICDVKRVSTPGRRVYADVFSLPRVQDGFGTAILSTSRGLLTDAGARAAKIGGEVVCYVW
ncbi:MAG: 30S ribosomal protein S8 [Candidatus Saganbacteria bacterium]|nr:30S ribosomal protein S8 [Candidatus Saganbacteria bacterium]